MNLKGPADPAETLSHLSRLLGQNHLVSAAFSALSYPENSGVVDAKARDTPALKVEVRHLVMSRARPEARKPTKPGPRSPSRAGPDSRLERAWGLGFNSPRPKPGPEASGWLWSLLTEIFENTKSGAKNPVASPGLSPSLVLGFGLGLSILKPRECLGVGNNGDLGARRYDRRHDRRYFPERMYDPLQRHNVGNYSKHMTIPLILHVTAAACRNSCHGIEQIYQAGHSRQAIYKLFKMHKKEGRVRIHFRQARGRGNRLFKLRPIVPKMPPVLIAVVFPTAKFPGSPSRIKPGPSRGFQAEPGPGHHPNLRSSGARGFPHLPPSRKNDLLSLLRHASPAHWHVHFPVHSESDLQTPEYRAKYRVKFPETFPVPELVIGTGVPRVVRTRPVPVPAPGPDPGSRVREPVDFRRAHRYPGPVQARVHVCTTQSDSIYQLKIEGEIFSQETETTGVAWGYKCRHPSGSWVFNSSGVCDDNVALPNDAKRTKNQSPTSKLSVEFPVLAAGHQAQLLVGGSLLAEQELW
ncbi:hypothetical protein C8R43DRAFT_947874 [Mycena crocata]|nr:hypothetical protein C8R43DRAFT_947874 [Mycena crocata]